MQIISKFKNILRLIFKKLKINYFVIFRNQILTKKSYTWNGESETDGKTINLKIPNLT